MSAAPSAGTTPPESRGHILCADDVGAMRVWYEYTLRPRGYRVTTVADGLELLAAWREHGATAILLDLQMPRLNGVETLKRLRQDPTASQVPVIIVSAYDGEQQISDSLAAGADDFLVKPVNRQELIAKIESHIKERRQAGAVTGFLTGAMLNGRYQLSHPLSKGARSVVYRGVDHANNGAAPVAVKVISFSPEERRDPLALRRFIREIYELTSLSHSGIVEVLDFGRGDGLCFLVMELLNGQTLDAVVHQRGCFREATVVRLGQQIADVLGYLQKHQVVHRGLHPRHLLLTSEGQLKLLDFFSARRPCDQTLGTARDHRDAIAYQAPELFQPDTPIDSSADIYAFGVTLFYLATAQFPFEHISIGDPATRRRRRLKKLQPATTTAFSDLLHRMLSPAPNDRPPLAAITETLQTLSIHPALS